MDAHGTVTAEEWGSIPPKTAIQSKKNSVYCNNIGELAEWIKALPC